MEEKIWKSHSAVKWDCKARLHDFGHSIRIANCIEDWKQDTKHDQVDDSNALQFETVFLLCNCTNCSRQNANLNFSKPFQHFSIAATRSLCCVHSIAAINLIYSAPRLWLSANIRKSRCESFLLREITTTTSTLGDCSKKCNKDIFHAIFFRTTPRPRNCISTFT